MAKPGPLQPCNESAPAPPADPGSVAALYTARNVSLTNGISRFLPIIGIALIVTAIIPAEYLAPRACSLSTTGLKIRASVPITLDLTVFLNGVSVSTVAGVVIPGTAVPVTPTLSSAVVVPDGGRVAVEIVPVGSTGSVDIQSVLDLRLT